MSNLRNKSNGNSDIETDGFKMEDLKKLEEDMENVINRVNSRIKKDEENSEIKDFEMEHLKTLEETFDGVMNSLSRMKVEMIYFNNSADKFVWKLENIYDKIFKIGQHEFDMTEKCYHSSGFYTSKYGYKMNVSAYPTRFKYGIPRSLAFSISLYKGKNDDFLNWPFKQIVCIEMLDQSGKGNHNRHINIFSTVGIDRPNDHPIRCHNRQAWDLGKLKRSPYLKNNRIYFRISVK